MRSVVFSAFAACLAFVLFGSVVMAQPAGESVPVVVAVDTSRSLDAQSFQALVAQLRDMLGELPADTPSGLLAFADEPTWLAGPSASVAATLAATDRLERSGRFTLLNDALFVATRALPDGGVILLVSDGRDENSATTVDDLARRSEAQGVRVLSAGVGQRIDERALRRLALVSDGEYLGSFAELPTADLGARVEAARRQIAETPEPRRGADPAAGSVASDVGAQAAELGPVDVGGAESDSGVDPVGAASGPEGEASGGGDRGAKDSGFGTPWLVGGLLGLILLMGLAAWALQRSRPSSDPGDPDEQRALDEAEAEMLRPELLRADAALPQDSHEMTVPSAGTPEDDLQERLDRTRVLNNYSVLLVRQPGDAPRSFLLDGERAFSVGRDRLSNTLGLPDPALSAQHFKIVPRERTFFFVDLDSTNGSLVDGRRTRSKRLRSGDIIRAGQVEFEFQHYA
ncbi:MAG: FHA domain-containing protein [Acidobacteriota bacterium]